MTRFILVSDVTSCFGRVGNFVATGIPPLAVQSPLNEVMIIMCMSSKADKLCDSKHMVEVSFVRLYVSFVQLFLSNDMLYAWVWHRLVSARPSLNDPIKYGGMKNADIF
jgi:hypothetical protein